MNNNTKVEQVRGKKGLTASDLDKLAKQKDNENSVLINTYNAIKRDVDKNPYLKNVEQSYKKYFEKKGADKRMRYEILSEIQTYLEELKERDDLMELDMKHIKHDQKLILEEMRNIKTELKKISV